MEWKGKWRRIQRNQRKRIEKFEREWFKGQIEGGGEELSCCDMLYLMTHSFYPSHYCIKLKVTCYQSTNDYQDIRTYIHSSTLHTCHQQLMQMTQSTSYISKTPESLIGMIPVFSFILIMLLITPTIAYNCKRGCDNEDMDDKPSVKFAIRNNNNNNKDLAKSHTVALTSHPIEKS